MSSVLSVSEHPDRSIQSGAILSVTSQDFYIVEKTTLKQTFMMCTKFESIFAKFTIFESNVTANLSDRNKIILARRSVIRLFQTLKLILYEPYGLYNMVNMPKSDILLSPLR